MTDPATELARDWLTRAERDLRSAELLDTQNSLQTRQDFYHFNAETGRRRESNWFFSATLLLCGSALNLVGLRRSFVRYLLTMPDPPPENVGFHAQQCTEKAFKGFLIFHQVAFERRHDLNYLIDLCAPIESAFEQFRAEVDELTPYAVEYRYPDAPALFTLEQAQIAVSNAGRICAFVLTQLGWNEG